MDSILICGVHISCQVQSLLIYFFIFVSQWFFIVTMNIAGEVICHCLFLKCNHVHHVLLRRLVFAIVSVIMNKEACFI